MTMTASPGRDHPPRFAPYDLTASAYRGLLGCAFALPASSEDVKKASAPSRPTRRLFGSIMTGLADEGVPGNWWVSGVAVQL